MLSFDSNQLRVKETTNLRTRNVLAIMSLSYTSFSLKTSIIVFPYFSNLHNPFEQQWVKEVCSRQGHRSLEIHLVSVRRILCTGWGRFSEHPCYQTSCHTGYNQVSNKMYGHYLSTDTPQFSVGLVVWILSIFFNKLKILKIYQLCSAERPNFTNTFFQMTAIHREIKILT